MSFFYYFGYGSNLLTKRIHVQNKTAQRIGIGRLENFKLDFADTNADKKYYSPTWNGSPATIIENNGSNVYGAVWKINNCDLEELDRQEGVECDIYKPLELDVYVEELQKEVKCRTYQLVDNPTTLYDPDERPFERQPSKTYLTVVVNGAIESKLPNDYIEFLKKFKHNGKLAFNKDLADSLDLKDVL